VKLQPEQNLQRRRGKKEKKSTYVYKPNTIVDLIEGKDIHNTP
jgi:hypothetical protein